MKALPYSESIMKALPYLTVTAAWIGYIFYIARNDKDTVNPLSVLPSGAVDCSNSTCSKGICSSVVVIGTNNGTNNGTGCNPSSFDLWDNDDTGTGFGNFEGQKHCTIYFLCLVKALPLVKVSDDGPEIFCVALLSTISYMLIFFRKELYNSEIANKLRSTLSTALDNDGSARVSLLPGVAKPWLNLQQQEQGQEQGQELAGAVI